MDFSEGLRVIGVKPEEKLSLFADNSCRWLVADQGRHRFEYLFPKLYFLFGEMGYNKQETVTCKIIRHIISILKL